MHRQPKKRAGPKSESDILKTGGDMKILAARIKRHLLNTNHGIVLATLEFRVVDYIADFGVTAADLVGLAYYLELQ
jgi:hypothetical protein